LNNKQVNYLKKINSAMIRKIKSSLLILSLLTTVNFSQSELRLPAIFSDNMVLQQSSDVPVWGKGNPNSMVKIFGSWGTIVESQVNSDSVWSVKIKTPEAGGPYKLTISDNEKNIEYQNVLIGEVWLCSGQSNMEMPLEGWPPESPIRNSKEEISNADNSQIRFFTVIKDISAVPKDNCKGEWTECNSKTAATFSATAFFFGQNLYNELKIPIGLIHSSWGGTPVEAWTSRKYLSKFDQFDSTFKEIDLGIPIEKNLQSWLNNFPVIDMTKRTGENIWSDLNFNDNGCSQIKYDDTKWDTMKLPTLWENTKFGQFDGAIWFRKNVQIPKKWINKKLIIELGPIDDFDVTFVNGNKVGAIEEDGNYQTKRIYSIPENVNNSDKMLIAVRVNDTRGGGGIYGKVDEMNLINPEDSSKISIAGNWRYLPVAEFKEMKYYVFGSQIGIFKERPELPIDFSAYTPTFLYNGMIAPIIPFNIKGVIWYQGEANTGNPKFYETLFPNMIENWRNDFSNNFPFYFVQIAPFDYGPDIKSEYLRDVQRKTMDVEKTGMAVTLDIGNPDNIHPADKQDVGMRLALWALNKDYGKNVIYSGPIYKSMKIKGDKIELEFGSTGSGLVVKDGKNQFEIAGDDQKFVPAKIKVKNNKLIIWSDSIKLPKAVRYAWSNIAQATLFNKEGLPASSFRTDNWK